MVFALFKGPQVSCLADYCDVFRCDVIQTKAQADYWDVALCRDADLKKVLQRCKVSLETLQSSLIPHSNCHVLCVLLDRHSSSNVYPGHYCIMTRKNYLVRILQSLMITLRN